MTMPEAAVSEDYGPPSGKDHVWSAGQISGVQAEAEAERMEPASQHQLWLRVAAANAAHIEASLFPRKDINHGSSDNPSLGGGPNIAGIQLVRAAGLPANPGRATRIALPELVRMLDYRGPRAALREGPAYGDIGAGV